MPRAGVKARTAAKYQTSWNKGQGHNDPPWKEWRFGIKPGARGKKYYTVQDVDIGDLKLNIKAVYNVTQKDASFFATGLRLWPSARILSLYLAAHPEVLTSADTILELGSGPGLAGIAAAKLCNQPSKVVMTDHNENVLELLQDNIDNNFESEKERPTCEFLDWCSGVERFKKRYGTFDVILGADIVYSERTIMPMLTTARTLLAEKPSAVFLLVYVGRLKVYDDMFRQCSTECQLHCTDVKLDSIPGALDIQDDSAMLHKIRVVVLRHKDLLDRSLDLLVAETLERVRTPEAEDAADKEDVENSLPNENPACNDATVDESTEYDRFPIPVHTSESESPELKETHQTSDGHDKRLTVTDETTGSPSECTDIVSLRDIATEVLVDTSEETGRAQPNKKDKEEMEYNRNADDDEEGLQADNSARKDNNVSDLSGTHVIEQTLTVMPPTRRDDVPDVGQEILKDDRKSSNQMKAEEDGEGSAMAMNTSVIPTTNDVVTDVSNEKPLIVSGALTADEPTTIQVTSTEDHVSLMYDVETVKTEVDSRIERHNTVHKEISKPVDDLPPNTEELSQNNGLEGNMLETSSEPNIDCNAMMEEVTLPKRPEALTNKNRQDDGICTIMSPGSSSKMVSCEERDRIGFEVDQEVESLTISNKAKHSDDRTLTKSKQVDKESKTCGHQASDFLGKTQNDTRKMKSFDSDNLNIEDDVLYKTVGVGELGSAKECMDSLVVDETTNSESSALDEVHHAADIHVDGPVNDILAEQKEAVSDDGVSREETVITKRNYGSDSQKEPSQKDTVSFDTVDGHVVVEKFGPDVTKPVIADSEGELDHQISVSENVATSKVKTGKESRTNSPQLDGSTSSMSLYSAMIYLVLIPTFSAVAIFLITLLVASIWFQVFLNT